MPGRSGWGFRASIRISWPSDLSRATSRAPMKPVPPVRVMFIVSILEFPTSFWRIIVHQGDHMSTMNPGVPPPPPPAKKVSPLVWILGIIAVLVLLVGGAAIVGTYFVVQKMKQAG